MPGWTTNGMPPVGAQVQNGTTVAAPAGSVTQITSGSLVPADTEAASGQPPQSVAPTAWQIAAHAAPLFKNLATSTAGAATLNTVSGMIQTESLSTAIGSTYTFTLTNSLITATTSPVPQMELLSFSNTGGQVQINSITNAAGSTVAVFQNIGSAAFNGTFLLPFHI